MKFRRGFTIIELLVAITIMLVLAYAAYSLVPAAVGGEV